ncbi:MAG: hypothetical protein AAFZ18_33105 [Myxococcota bacterium]
MSELLSASPRKLREEMFRRLGIKAKGRSGFKLASKGDARAGRFGEVLASDTEIDDEILDELARNYLFGRRELLGDALDFLGIEHNEGLTDSELDFFEELEAEKESELRGLLAGRGHEAKDVDLYFALMRLGTKRST